MSVEEAQTRKGFIARLGLGLKSKKSQARLTKAPPPRYALEATRSRDEYQELPLPATLEAHRNRYRNTDQKLDSQLGESIDHTALLHGLAHRGSFDSFKNVDVDAPDLRPPGDSILAEVSPEIWDLIVDYLNPTEAANLALASKTLLGQIGYKPWNRLDMVENRQYRINFLLPMDCHLPHQLFCFPCASYHIRIAPGSERLRSPGVLNPVFNCPNQRNPVLRPPRARITPKRNLPFTFLQLVLRSHRYSPNYGITIDSLSRRFKEGDWSHLTRYHVHNGHLLMRVVSSCFAMDSLPPAAMRMLLYSREDYTPYFSVCAHWKNGELMKLCKCALGHIPASRPTEGPQLLKAKIQERLASNRYNPNSIVTLCANCQPMRRCPFCPTEYLIEIRLMEDKESRNFRRAIVVTRWSDLGDESMSQEWRAVDGEDRTEYDSFKAIGKRALSGIFESYYTHDAIPGQRILSLNPKREKEGEDEEDWY